MNEASVMKESEVSDLKKEQGQSQQQIQTQQEELNQLNQKLAKLKNLLGRGNVLSTNRTPIITHNQMNWPFFIPLITILIIIANQHINDTKKELSEKKAEATKLSELNHSLEEQIDSHRSKYETLEKISADTKKELDEMKAGTEERTRTIIRKYDTKITDLVMITIIRVHSIFFFIIPN